VSLSLLLASITSDLQQDVLGPTQSPAVPFIEEESVQTYYSLNLSIF